jgi:hypothetical protein
MASRVVTSGDVPDDVAEIPVVELVGASMLAIVEAIPEFEARTGRSATVIGGLAVLCRLGTVYRVTGDLVRYSKPHVIEKKKSPRAASNASS